MHDELCRRWLGRLFALLCVALLPQVGFAAETGSAKAQAERQAIQPGNNAPVWRDVRGGDHPYQTTQVRGVETSVLVQSQGQIWREIRNGPITVYGGWLLILVTAAIGVYYWRKGPLKVQAKPTGRMIERFSDWDRIVHWATAISFCVLGITGLTILFGKYVLLPVFGYTLFSWLAVLAKNLHNFVGPLFAICTVLMFVTFVRDNLPSARDWLWVRKAGGLITGEHVPSGRFNAGEKSWFWVGVIMLGVAAAVTGAILDFPNFAQGRGAMQLANVIHAVVAVAFIALSLGHIYMGTIGVEGAYESMRNGSVDESWAREHHEDWYNEIKASEGRRAPGGAATAATASPMTEGWKI
jgi:formate dehydrogenase subunit gamma